MTDPARSDLAIPDFDHLPVAGLGHRIRSLDADQLQKLVDFEEAHGNRLPALQVMRTRLAQLADGATPSGGDPAGPVPGASAAPDGDGKVQPDTQGPVQNPPSHGDPTNPAQPR